jgi:tRNA G26 N,N-dimethylase Trm1
VQLLEDLDLLLSTEKFNAFYNSRRASSRILLVDVIRFLHIRRYFDLCSGTGIRSILVNRLSPLTQVHAYDASSEAVSLIEQNNRKNKTSVFSKTNNAYDFNLKVKPGDLIDIDCFGSGVQMLEAILSKIRKYSLRGVYFLLFSSDLRVLCGVMTRRKLWSRYGSSNPKGPLANDTGLRILCARVISLFNKYGLGCIIQFAYHHEHYFQILVQPTTLSESNSPGHSENICMKCNLRSTYWSYINYCTHGGTNVQRIHQSYRGVVGSAFNSMISRVYGRRIDILRSDEVEFNYAAYSRLTKYPMLGLKHLIVNSGCKLTTSQKNGFIRVSRTEFRKWCNYLNQGLYRI